MSSISAECDRKDFLRTGIDTLSAKNTILGGYLAIFHDDEGDRLTGFAFHDLVLLAGSLLSVRTRRYKLR